MKKVLISLLFLALYNSTWAQTYTDEIAAHREKYKQDFIAEELSPIKKNDLKYLQFFDADENYRVKAKFTITENAQPFYLPTMNGGKKVYIEYGTLSFKLLNDSLKLKVYQSITLMQSEEYKDYLFLPFTDKTNGTATYGGGRYLDFKKSDITNNEMIIDFNKAYNPYCAYSEGYSCPKPPEDNALKIQINAGEKEFVKHVHEKN